MADARRQTVCARHNNITLHNIYNHYVISATHKRTDKYQNDVEILVSIYKCLDNRKFAAYTSWVCYIGLF